MNNAKTNARKVRVTKIEVANTPTASTAIFGIKSTTPKATKAKKVNKTKTISISRTGIVKMINKTGGKFFGLSVTTADGSFRKFNAIKPKGGLNELGYMLIYSVKDKGIRSVDPKNILEYRSKGKVYKARK